MAIIQRPTKQGNATTYQGKVAAGYTKILAAEVDADLDLIYSAWNQGVDSVNIRPGSITGDKLAPGAVGTRELQDGGIQTVDIGDGQVTTPKIADGNVTAGKLVGGGTMGGDLTGTYPNPSLGIIQSGQVKLQPRATLTAATNYFEIEANISGQQGYDASKPTWLVRVDYNSDAFAMYRAPAGTTTFTQVFLVTGAGILTTNLADSSVYRNHLAVNAIFGSAAPVSVAPPTNFVLTTGNVWTTLATLPSLTTRGGFVFLNANHDCSISSPAGGAVASQRWLRDGVSVATWPFQAATTVYTPFPGINFIDNPPAGAHVYSYQMQVQAGAAILSSNVPGGLLQAVEVG